MSHSVCFSLHSQVETQNQVVLKTAGRHSVAFNKSMCSACFGVARFALLYFWLYVSSCLNSLYTPFTLWTSLKLHVSFPCFHSSLFLHLSIHLSPSYPLLASCFPVLLCGCYGEGQPVRVCACTSMIECVSVWVNPSLRGWGGDSRSHKNTRTNKHTHCDLLPQNVD